MAWHAHSGNSPPFIRDVPTRGQDTPTHAYTRTHVTFRREPDGHGEHGSTGRLAPVRHRARRDGAACPGGQPPAHRAKPPSPCSASGSTRATGTHSTWPPARPPSFRAGQRPPGRTAPRSDPLGTRLHSMDGATRPTRHGRARRNAPGAGARRRRGWGMIVYQATKATFLHDTDHDQIEDVVERQFVQKTGRYASQGEFKAWRNSLAAMARVLRDGGIPDD